MAFRTLGTRARAWIAAAGVEPLPLQRMVDLERYTAGPWYSFASIPMLFQPSDSINVRASYKLSADKKLVYVVNQSHVPAYSCTGPWEETSWMATAYPTNNFNSTLAFCMSPGQYWMLELADDYSWVVVGSPMRTSLWVMTRQPGQWPASAKISYEELLSVLSERHGYDTSLLEVTQHDTSESGELSAPVFHDTPFLEATMNTAGKEVRRNIRMVVAKTLGS
jgi:apolipoprotein D and lipocalin family protein